MNILWEILRWLAHADLLGYHGFNVFSVSLFGLMFLTSVYKFYKLNSPFSLKKIPLILMLSTFTLLLYYTLLDRTSGIVFALTRPYLIEQLVYELLIFSTRIPFNLIPLTFPMVYFYGIKQGFIDVKNLTKILLIQIVWILITVLIFNDWNMRNLSGDLRTTFYITNFIPMWIFWAYGYTKIIKTNSSPQRTVS